MIGEGRKPLPVRDPEGRMEEEVVPELGARVPPREAELQQSVLAGAGGAEKTERWRKPPLEREMERYLGSSLSPTLQFQRAPPIG